jgi:hypothetical protein
MHVPIGSIVIQNKYDFSVDFVLFSIICFMVTNKINIIFLSIGPIPIGIFAFLVVVGCKNQCLTNNQSLYIFAIVCENLPHY